MIGTMNNAKRLHVHATPLAVFAFAATLAILTLGTASYSHETRLAFVRPVVKLAPAASGLSLVQLNTPATNAELLQQAVAKATQAQAAGTSTDLSGQTQTPVLPGVEGLGHSAALQLSVN